MEQENENAGLFLKRQLSNLQISCQVWIINIYLLYILDP